MKSRIIIFCSLLICFNACMGDGMLSVVGQVIDLNNKPIENCSLEVHLAEDGRLLRSQTIESKFFADFGIAPKSYDYFFVIQCPDLPGYKYESEIYKISGSKYVKTPLDLGRIVMGFPK